MASAPHRLEGRYNEGKRTNRLLKDFRTPARRAGVEVQVKRVTLLAQPLQPSNKVLLETDPSGRLLEPVAETFDGARSRDGNGGGVVADGRGGEGESKEGGEGFEALDVGLEGDRTAVNGGLERGEVRSARDCGESSRTQGTIPRGLGGRLARVAWQTLRQVGPSANCGV